MEFDNKFMERAKSALVDYLDNYDLPTDHVETIFEHIEGREDILGPVCSRCENAEPNIDIVDNSMEEPWWYLINISCRCAMTCKEYTSCQLYYDKNGKTINPGDKERYPTSVVHKAGCVHFSSKSA
ncbi:hypothetical protein [Solidesulfovibrio carbinolicus]|uniref:hypothetical protein n=1 Tax=Solidesulfovibrio carbinolicus TaxID=296842 RepID=UPI001010F4B3|nr:hypothetical protein [Solidesulfovibrio carbinolicus]